MRFKMPAVLVVVAALLACSKEKTCPSDQMLCDGACAAVVTDPANCGTCGVSCGPGGVCLGGTCQCAPEAAQCGPSCADLSSDPDHCGGCDTACPSTQVCTTSGSVASCADLCAAGQTACGRACVDLESNRFNCGACGRACGTNEHCQGGLCLADLYLACFNTNEVRESTATLQPAGTPLLADQGPLGLTWLGGTLYVANSITGTVSSVTFGPPAVHAINGAGSIKIPSPGSSDLEYIASHGGLLYFSNAAVGTVVIIDPATGGIVDETPLAVNQTDFPNPQGIAFVTQLTAPTDRAYVALNGMHQVAVLDVSGETGCLTANCAQVLTRVDVQTLASAGGLAMPARLALRGTKLYVTLWNLDASFNPSGSGRLAVIDTATDELDSTVTSGGVTGLIDLGPDCEGPGDLALLGDTLYVTCGAFSAAGIVGAGIVPVDLSVTPPSVKPIVPVNAGEAPGKLVFCGGVGYAGDRNSGQVLRFEPVSGQVTQRASLCPAANGFAYVADLTCGP